MKDCTFPQCGCSEREQCRPADLLAEVTRLQSAVHELEQLVNDTEAERNAAIARAEAAEAALRDAERRAVEAAESMRERAAKVCEKSAMRWQGTHACRPLDDAADAIRALTVENDHAV